MTPAHFIDIAATAARQAGARQLANLGKVKEIEYKGEINLVTEVDKACEALIIDSMTSHFPDHDILAEEGGGERKDSAYKWIIDPLDGTTNYAHSYPLFCVSIALEYKGEIIIGVVYDPNRDEMFIAEKGAGATLNGNRIRVSSCDPLDRALLATGFAYNIRSAKINNINHFKDFLATAQAVRRDGVAAIDLCYVACGRYDGFWELNLFPWDVAAGFLMITEAGGKVSMFNEKAFEVYAKEIVASNGRLHREMCRILSRPTNTSNLLACRGLGV